MNTTIKDYILLYADDPQRILDYSKNGYVLYGTPFAQADRSFQAMVLYTTAIESNYHYPQTDFDLK